jgi:hypothetical protein
MKVCDRFKPAAEIAYGNSVFSSIGRQIRVRSAPGGIVHSGRIEGVIVLQVAPDGILLIIWDRKVVRESSTRIEKSRGDELFARALRLIHGGICID